jgi:hypothetical protein
MDQRRHRLLAGETRIPQGSGGVEAHGVQLALQGIGEGTNLRGWLRAGSQQRTHCLGADGVISIIPGGFPQSGVKRGQHATDPRTEVAQGLGRPEADALVGVGQQGQEAWHRC